MLLEPDLSTVPLLLLVTFNIPGADLVVSVDAENCRFEFCEGSLHGVVSLIVIIVGTHIPQKDDDVLGGGLYLCTELFDSPGRTMDIASKINHAGSHLSVVSIAIGFRKIIKSEKM